MDAVKFIKEDTRMCDSHYRCSRCPISQEIMKGDEVFLSCGQFRRAHPDVYVSVVEQWSKEHPLVTNAQKFKEVFGVGPEYCSSPLRTSETGNVLAHEWWDEPYKEPEGKE
jgi:hypothetical protein